MLKSKPFIIGSVAVFAVAEAIMGYFIQKVSGIDYAVLTLSSVFLACAFCALWFNKSFNWIFTFTALCFTVFADLFLTDLIRYEYKQSIAMVFFTCVQICYFLRIYFNQTDKRQKIIHVSVRAGLSVFAIVLTAVVLKENANFLSLISMFYFANLAANIVFSFMQFKLNPLFPIGLTLFSFCDILIGLEMLDNFMTIPETSFINKINDVQINLAWAFYVPSQTLISLSSIKYKN